MSIAATPGVGDRATVSLGLGGTERVTIVGRELTNGYGDTSYILTVERDNGTRQKVDEEQVVR